jgi:hypothetical protein
LRYKSKKFGDIGTGTILAKIVKLRRFFSKFSDIAPPVSMFLNSKTIFMKLSSKSSAQDEPTKSIPVITR